MANKLSGWDDTIVALATPPGIGAIGVIRLSGSEAIQTVNAIFPSKNLLSQPAPSLHVGLIQENGDPIDEVVLSLFKGPRSYTGEDVVEISCHGSPFVQQEVINACMRQGARMAKPGEFTQRAFLKGKLDLTQAEAVADLIASNTKAAQRSAIHNIRGGFSAVLKDLRENLIQFSALIELELDFSQEDVEFADRTKFNELINSAVEKTDALIASFRLGNVIKNGVSVAIIGKPNAGKSTLLNSLLNDERAIVSSIAGTTRDTIEEVLNIDGVLFRLIDTAGIRDHTTDEIEAIGMERSIEKMKSADIVLYVYDAAETNAAELSMISARFQAEGIRYMLLSNKADRKGPNDELAEKNNILQISAKNNTGIDVLKERLFNETVEQELSTENVIVSNSRHQQALEKVATSLEDIRHGLNDNVPGDLLALNIRHCLHYISEITGDISNETVLDYVFSKFCIGK
ncbi:MAG: mnmE [Ferruginibacter sp.]|nr:mnmE [Ferruginibacter sp.]